MQNFVTKIVSKLGEVVTKTANVVAHATKFYFSPIFFHTIFTHSVNDNDT